MSQATGVADPRWVADQYRNACNLGARVALHQRFSTNTYGWHRWVLDQLHLPEACQILELGGGAGDLWMENLERMPEGWEIVLSDLSVGMVSQARRRLGGGRHRFRFGVIDAQSIPFERERFDAVIANHMLYHVPDRDRALAEIWRVLRPGGRLYASTVSHRHLVELDDLVARFDGALAFPREMTFRLENGAAQLARWFAEIELCRYEDALVVTESAPVVAYILSGRMSATGARQSKIARSPPCLRPVGGTSDIGGRRDEFARFVERELAASGGAFHVTKDSGLFVAVRDDQTLMEKKRWATRCCAN
jgi:ubiquinone/menaquinone biosynthesis C-methylase UbiE